MLPVAISNQSMIQPVWNLLWKRTENTKKWKPGHLNYLQKSASVSLSCDTQRRTGERTARTRLFCVCSTWNTAEGSLQIHVECTVITGRQHAPTLIVAASRARVIHCCSWSHRRWQTRKALSHIQNEALDIGCCFQRHFKTKSHKGKWNLFSPLTWAKLFH